MTVDTALDIVEHGDPPPHVRVLADEVKRLRDSVTLLTKYACPSAVRLAAHEQIAGEVL